MMTLNLALPEPLLAFVEEQVASGNYDTASDFVQALIREARERRQQERLEELLLEGLDSGPPVEATPEFWQRLNDELLERHQAKRRA